MPGSDVRWSRSEYFTTASVQDCHDLISVFKPLVLYKLFNGHFLWVWDCHAQYFKALLLRIKAFLRLSGCSFITGFSVSRVFFFCLRAESSLLPLWASISVPAALHEPSNQKWPSKNEMVWFHWKSEITEGSLWATRHQQYLWGECVAAGAGGRTEQRRLGLAPWCLLRWVLSLCILV